MNHTDFEKFLKNQGSPHGKIPPEWEQEILGNCRQEQFAPGKEGIPAQRSIRDVFSGFLNEWLWPSPRVWAAMACVWLVILTSNFIFHSENSRPLTPEEKIQREFLLAQFVQRMNQNHPDNL